MKKPREVIQPRWGRLSAWRQACGAHAVHTVTAPNSEEAIERAIMEYEIPEHERFRISVRRES